MDGREPETDRVVGDQPGKAWGDRLRILVAENWERADVFPQRKDFFSIAFSDWAHGGALWWLGGRRGEQELEGPIGGAGVLKWSRPGLRGAQFRTAVVGMERR